MKIPKIPLAQSIILLCKAKEIKHIVISPGSRNAPLTIGFTNDDFFECHSVVDERSAAFFALGIAQQIAHPVAVVCTSGSAMLNYYPAVAEAFYSDIPLVVLSADRPDHLVGIGDGQTIDQKGVYGNHVVHSVNLNQDHYVPGLEPHEKEAFSDIQSRIQTENERAINLALNAAIDKIGPVHINCPFDEPLYETVDEYVVSGNDTAPKKEVKALSDSEFNEILEIWNASKRKMILVGVNAPRSLEQKVIEGLASDKSTIVFTETTSNMQHDGFFPSIDKIIAPLEHEEYQDLQPELLLTFGGMIVSKKIKAFLRRYRAKHHWHIDVKKANDTFFSLSKHIELTPNDFFSRLLSVGNTSNSEYAKYWKIMKERRNKKHESYIGNIEFTDLLAFHYILRSLPDSIDLHLSNSSTIRYVQLFDLNKTINVFCNRGTSGIDGSTSTAIGAATISRRQSVLITGDLSFFYDINALWNDHIKNDFRVIVINNGGGGIFRILPGDKASKNFDTYFETTHDHNASDICRMHGIAYHAVDDPIKLASTLNEFYSASSQAQLLEIFTPRTMNDQVLLDYFKFIR